MTEPMTAERFIELLPAEPRKSKFNRDEGGRPLIYKPTSEQIEPRAHRRLTGVFAIVEELAKAGISFEDMERGVLDAVYELAFFSGKEPVDVVPFVARAHVLYGGIDA